MKILKVKVKREPKEGGGTRYVYPEGYDPRKCEVLCYESIGDEPSVLARGKFNYEFCLIVVKDEYARQFLVSPDVFAVSKDEAVTLGSKWRPQSEVVADQNKVLAILAKKARGLPLSQTELDALDPDHPERGLNKGQSFVEFLEGYLK